MASEPTRGGIQRPQSAAEWGFVEGEEGANVGGRGSPGWVLTRRCRSSEWRANPQGAASSGPNPLPSGDSWKGRKARTLGGGGAQDGCSRGGVGPLNGERTHKGRHPAAPIRCRVGIRGRGGRRERWGAGEPRMGAHEEV